MLASKNADFNSKWTNQTLDDVMFNNQTAKKNKKHNNLTMRFLRGMIVDGEGVVHRWDSLLSREEKVKPWYIQLYPAIGEPFLEIYSKQKIEENNISQRI